MGKTVVNPDYLMTAIPGLKGYSTDGAIDSRSGPTANDYTDSISGRRMTT
jgi:hypothetical protein